MTQKSNTQPDWLIKGKSISGLTKELETYENSDFEVLISVDGGATLKQISLLGKAVINGKIYCVLKSFSEEVLIPDD